MGDGTEINRLGAKYREILGYLPQQFGYYKSYSPKSYLMYLAALKGMDKKTAKAKIDQVLHEVALENDAKSGCGSFLAVCSSGWALLRHCSTTPSC